MRSIRLEVGSDGIALVALDVPDVSMNVLSPAVICELSSIVEQIAARQDIRGAIITSAKKVFAAGWDLKDLLGMLNAHLAPAEAFERTHQFSRVARRMEACGKPFACAINGLALGGGLELALACHYRVLADDPKAVVGLPEVKVGLLPGAGGTQRLSRLIGIEKSLPLLLEGTHVAPAEALKLGIVHELAPTADVVAAARRWLLSKPDAQQPWDRKGYRPPGGGGIANPALQATFTVGSALVAKNTQHNYPAPISILSCVFEGMQVPFETGLKIEGKYFARLVCDPVALNLVRTMFVNKGHADKLNRRPADVPKSQVRQLGIVGAGMMGSGIAYVSALAGIECVLLDSTLELAEKGKSYSQNLLERELEKGRTTPERAKAALARIKTTTDYTDLGGCELVIEAVFERRDIKADVTRKAEAIIAKSAVFASNTSTLPISGLAEAAQRPHQFIGIHFFSPVERMPLVEIILGKKTSRETLARALDYVGQLRKTPIVVNDSRGFYTSRVFGMFCYEGMQMLAEGVSPALIENGARMAGMPVGPLAVSDEVTIELLWKVIRQGEEDLGSKYQRPVAYDIVRRFVEELKRPGRRFGHGFYEYPQGGRKFLWPGLAQLYPPRREQPCVAEVKKRLLYIQALETARCLEEGVLESAAEADLGSILGWGFPACTGGTLSLIDTVGIGRFVAECERMARSCGPRFKPSRWLRKRAQQGQAFHAPEAADPRKSPDGRESSDCRGSSGGERSSAVQEGSDEREVAA